MLAKEDQVWVLLTLPSSTERHVNVNAWLMLGPPYGEAFQWKDSPLCGSVFLVGKHVKGSLGVGGIDTNASEFGVSGKASCPAPGGLSVFGIV